MMAPLNQTPMHLKMVHGMERYGLSKIKKISKVWDYFLVIILRKGTPIYIDKHIDFISFSLHYIALADSRSNQMSKEAVHGHIAVYGQPTLW